MLSRGLSALLIAGTFSLASGTQAFDRTCTQNQGMQSQEAQGQRVGRCMAAVTVPETIVYGTLSDHGMAVGEPYDAQGNPIDRQGNVVAVPAGPASATREVFAQEPAFRR